MEKYGRAIQATDDNTIQRMRTACWIIKATDTHSEYVILKILLFHSSNGDAKAPQCYVYAYIACLVCGMLLFLSPLCLVTVSVHI